MFVFQDGETGRSSLLVVCGDHGMSDQGSHGGASVHEVNTPVVLISPQWDEGTGKSVCNLTNITHLLD